MGHVGHGPQASRLRGPRASLKRPWKKRKKREKKEKEKEKEEEEKEDEKEEEFVRE